MVDDTSGRHAGAWNTWSDRLLGHVGRVISRSRGRKALLQQVERWSAADGDELSYAPASGGRPATSGRVRSRSALFVSHADTVGGAEIFLFDIMDVHRGSWDACFLCDGASARKARARGFDPKVINGAESVLSLTRGASLAGSIRALGGLWSAAIQLARVAKDYKVIVANSQKALFVCAIASVLARRPLVWILHDILLDPSFSAAALRAAVLTANHVAAAVVANSESTRASFGAVGGDLSRTTVVYNGFHLDHFHAHTEDTGRALRDEFGLDERPVVGLFGRLTRWKGQHVLLEALARTPGVQAIVVGGTQAGEEDYAREIRDLADRLGISERVRFVSFRDDVYRLMSGVDVVVHTSTSAEPFGRVVAEGLLSGRPVIATAGGGVNEIIEHESTGLLVPPNDPQALADALFRVLGDPALGTRVAAGGLDFARRSFDVVTIANQIDAIVKSVSRTAGRSARSR